MAIVRQLTELHLERDSRHTEVSGTYTVVSDSDGAKYLQIDTYGSKERQDAGKKSQSIRFSPEAISQLKEIINQM
jgi:hypothetical protein